MMSNALCRTLLALIHTMQHAWLDIDWLQTGVSPADLSTMHGEVLLLRHVITLMKLDLQLRVKVFYLQERQCEKLIYNSILWHLYAVQRLSSLPKHPN